MVFTYKSKGSADDWTEDTIEAANEAEAISKLDQIYGIKRDDEGNQTNAHIVQVELK